jgi:hypothetical protein
MKPAPCKTWLIVIVHVCFREEENVLDESVNLSCIDVI